MTVAILAQDSLQQTSPSHRPPVFPLGSQSREHRGKLIATMPFDATFRTLLTECGVPVEFQQWLVQNTFTSRERLLAAAPNSVDADLINEYVDSGGRLNLGERVYVRLAFTACERAATENEFCRAAVRSSPETAEIGGHDKKLLMDRFFRKHGRVLSMRWILCPELINTFFTNFMHNHGR